MQSLAGWQCGPRRRICAVKRETGGGMGGALEETDGMEGGMWGDGEGRWFGGPDEGAQRGLAKQGSHACGGGGGGGGCVT